MKSFEDYLREVRMLRRSTIKRYVDTVERFRLYLAKKPRLRKVALKAVKKRVIVTFLRDQPRGTEEPSRSVWNSQLAALRSFYSYLAQEELVTENPAEHVQRLKTMPRIPEPLTLDEYLSVISAIERHAPEEHRARNVAVVHIFFHCGLRLSEVASLNVAQVDIVSREFTNVRTKGGKWLSAPFNDLVSSAVEKCLAERSKLSPDEQENALFVSERGTRWSRRMIEEMVKHYARLAGVRRRVSPHVLRHSCATELNELGASLATIQEHLGHSSVSTTRRYTHVHQSARRKAVNALGRRAVARLRASRRASKKA